MPALITKPNNLPHLVAQHHNDFEVMTYLLQRDEVSDASLDARVATIAEKITAAIDCTQCGNCCRSLPVYLTPHDAQRLSEGLHIPRDQVMDRYIDQQRAAAVEEWGCFRQKPCAFLKGNLCIHYDYRPDSCREYPVFTPDFRWILPDLIQGAATCPIIYNVLCQVLSEIDDIMGYPPKSTCAGADK